MKSHDLGQFLFNGGTFNEIQMPRIISASKRSEPSLAVESLFLQLVSAEELTQLLRADRYSLDENVRHLITPRQASRAEQLKDGQSIRLAQGLLENGLANFLKLDRILDRYYALQVPPLESMITRHYERLGRRMTIDFPFAVELIRELHAFLSDTLCSTVIILPPSEDERQKEFGASVKMDGDIPSVTGVFSDTKTLMKLAARFDASVENLDDAFDALSEMLNVFVGHFAVKAATQRGIDVLPEPPRFGSIESESCGFCLLTDVGKFYVYLGREEIFS